MFKWQKYGLLFLMLIAACETEYNIEFLYENVQQLVVDGIITNENKPQLIKLSLTNNEINAGENPLSGASVTVSDQDSSYVFTESFTEAGAYYSVPFTGVVEKVYHLEIEIESHYFEAYAEMTGINSMENFYAVPAEEGNLYRYVYQESSLPSMTDVLYDWSEVPWYCTQYGSYRAIETFYTLHNVDVNEVFGPAREIIYFPPGTTIIRKKYSLSDEHQEYLRSLLIETEWRGGLFDVQQGNVTSNISNGGLGFFGACMVMTDTTLFLTP
ncbi:MAG: DUF4249 family protein [Bacteroidales bacterium]|nr:DUF4249 family protein [Bacteroidales bacterium]